MFICCISSDATFSRKYAVPFGGFESCETGNPFVLKSVSNMNSPENYPRSCPFAYTKYPIIFDDGCWINAYACFSIQPVVFKHC